MVAWPAAAGTTTPTSFARQPSSTGRSVRRTSTTTAREGDQNMGRTCSLGPLTGPKASGRTLATRRAFYIVWEGKRKGGPWKWPPHRCSIHSFPPRLTLLFPMKIVVWWSAPNRDKISLSCMCECVCVCVHVQSTFLQDLLCDRDVHQCPCHEASTCFFCLQHCSLIYLAMGVMHRWSLLERNPLLSSRQDYNRNSGYSKAVQTPHRPQPDRAAPEFWIRTTPTQHRKVSVALVWL